VREVRCRYARAVRPAATGDIRTTTAVRGLAALRGVKCYHNTTRRTTRTESSVSAISGMLAIQANSTNGDLVYTIDRIAEGRQ
jgi:hypothetical protein